ncbi:MAG TPA: hypothetical protein VFW98_08360 [Gemmatimonadaceae bacterium]|nr:hypothetical protein [Gemmatimonadaceae bacterium]
MARVIALHYDRLKDRRTGITFTPHRVRRHDGAMVMRGVAHVSDEVARAYYVGHPGFMVDALGDPTPSLPSAHSTEVPATSAVSDVVPATEPAPEPSPSGRGRSRSRG